MIKLEDISIRTDLQPGDMGYVTYMHGCFYKQEYNYSINFELYVMQGLAEFQKNYQADKDGVWIAEYEGKIVGFLLSMHREHNTAQLRYFILDSSCRGIGLGQKLCNLYLDFVKQKGFKSVFLWTTDELFTAAHIYKKMGFVLTEEIGSDSFGKTLKEQRYDLNL
ncbi:GNAT family N-acetyltransferase [Pedobacter caeni]|uniref:Acetyltransferase (GNAT) domain-containing protein n=1 Tax=Pedobacter caeni TaxID=288992 RepID=A0A1M5ACP2_9SPHI|nr:GNAT family N-acetyltransferase [Pedobacter caeni]SHF28029.1 Acetyltransferase (GNAT) domain-containing protein [Pedobacter caeni]